LAEILKRRKPLVAPEPYYRWAVNWVEDIGTIMRSRQYIAGTIAGYISYAVLLALISFFPGIKRFEFISRVLGVR